MGIGLRVYSMVCDSKNHLHAQAKRLIWSLTALAGVLPDSIVVHYVGELPAEFDAYLDHCGVKVVSVGPFHGHPPCNKLMQLASLTTMPADEYVLLDCDTIVRKEPPVPPVRVAGKPVDLANPRIHVLKSIYETAGLNLQLTKTDIDQQPTAVANVNGGVYLIPGQILPVLSTAWLRWAQWGSQNRELFGTADYHIDQVSFSMAVSSESIPFSEVDRRYNLPTHLPQDRGLDRDPFVLHYHGAVDQSGQLTRVNDLPMVNQAIDEVNHKLVEAGLAGGPA